MSIRRDSSPGTLYIVATPIGHPDDISLRALRVLREADLVVCEELKEGRRLLHRYDISRPLIDLNEHNEAQRTPELAARLARGEVLALISDAGTPLLADPGQALVEHAYNVGAKVTAIPGPSALLAALVVSGLPMDRFRFVGYLPAKREERRRALLEEGREVLGLMEAYADWVFEMFEEDAPICSQFPARETNFMALVNGEDQHYDIYDGHVRIISGSGEELALFHPSRYYDYIREAVWEHSSTKVPYYKPEGANGNLRVGPLARLNVASRMPWPNAREYEERYLKLFPRTCTQVQGFNLARIPELVAAQEEVLSINIVQRQTDAGEKTRFRALVAVGNGDGVLGLGLIMFGRPVDRMNVLIGLAVSIVNVMMFRFLKLVFSRERPIPVEYTLRSRVIDTYSFPSGHATTSFGLAWVVVTSYPHPLVGLGVYLVAALISFSRVFVREHYPLDVLFGAVLGSLIAAYFDPLFRWLTF